MLIGTVACAPLDTAQQNVKKKTECKGTLGRMLDMDGANTVRTRTGSREKGESRGDRAVEVLYGNLLRLTRSPQETAEQCCEPIARNTQFVFVLRSMTDEAQKKKKQDTCPAFLFLVTRTGIEPMFSA